MLRAQLALLVCVLGSLPASAAEPALLMLSGGAFDANKQFNPATEFGLQWRGGGRWWRLGPMAGAMATTDSAFDAYFGFSLELPLGTRVALRGSFAPSYYSKGDGKDLHGELQFRSGIEASWRFGRGLRLGLELYHLSNAGLQDLNPGEESLMLTFALPVGGVFGH
jgi:hypothetical protein